MSAILAEESKKTLHEPWDEMHPKMRVQLRKMLRQQYEILVDTEKQIAVYEAETGVAYYDIPPCIASYWLHRGKATILADLLHEICRY